MIRFIYAVQAHGILNNKNITVLCKNEVQMRERMGSNDSGRPVHSLTGRTKE